MDVIVNGISLKNAVSNIVIMDIEKGAVEYEQNIIGNPSGDGIYIGESKKRKREVKIPIRVLSRDTTVKATARRQITEWSKIGEKVEIAFDDVSGLYLVGTCTATPSYPNDYSKQDLIISFICEPQYRATAEKVVSIGNKFTVEGHAAGLWEIEQRVTDEIDGPAWMSDTGKEIRLTGTYANTTLVISFEKKAIYQDGEVIKEMTMSSRFFELEPGIHKITGENGAAGVVKIRERWDE